MFFDSICCSSVDIAKVELIFYHVLSQGAWVLKPRKTKPRSVVHFVGGIFVGAAPQLTYRLFLEGLAEK